MGSQIIVFEEDSERQQSVIAGLRNEITSLQEEIIENEDAFQKEKQESETNLQRELEEEFQTKFRNLEESHASSIESLKEQHRAEILEHEKKVREAEKVWHTLANQ